MWWGVFSLGERHQALDRIETGLQFTVATLADASVIAIRAENLTQEDVNANRAAAIARALLRYPGAHIWVEENDSIAAGKPPEGPLDRHIFVEESRVAAGNAHGAFKVRAAIATSDALARWTTTVRMRTVALFAMTIAFLLLTHLLARSIRERAAAELRTATAMKRLILRDRALEAITQGITITDQKHPTTPIIYTNPAFAALMGRDVDKILGRTPKLFFGSDKVDEAQKQIVTAARAEKRPWRLELEVARKDGTSFIDNLATSYIFDDDGSVSYSVTVHEDVTEVRQREELLLNAHKMESVGQLTGGIAHDFNNLLTAIRSNAEDLKEDLKGKPLALRQADIVLQAATRGAGLVAQLMAFARTQELHPRNVDSSQLVGSFTKLMRNSLPADIQIDVREAKKIPPLFVDPVRLESALLNLCLNSRDAMPGGGTITIETMVRELDEDYVRENLDVSPGPHVMIAVTDTGSGMSREVIEKAFTPFFTTKEVGEGTGLGLSMVYGFVKQSGGHVKIYSETGFGTVVRIYLPVLGAAAEDELAARRRALRGNGSILIVEDDELVRQSISNKLTAFGYAVLAAPNADHAIEILNTTPDFDLVFSDVIMPGSMNGADLVREVRNRWPKVNVLLTSGYTESTVTSKVNIPAGVKLLSKPYSNAELADTVRVAMGIAAA